MQVDKLQYVDTKQLEQIAILVNNHGLSVIIVLTILVFGTPYLIILLRSALKNIFKTQIEILKQLTLLTEAMNKLSRNDWTDEELKLFVFYSIADIRWNTQNYIISKIHNNNIKENFELFWKDNIKGEAQTQIDDHIRIFKTTSNNKIQIRNILEAAFIKSVNEIFEVFENQINEDKVEYQKLIYATDKYLNIFQNATKEEINRLF